MKNIPVYNKVNYILQNKLTLLPQILLPAFMGVKE